MQVDELDNIIKDTSVFEKVLLAYWYSIPYDNANGPERIELRQNNGTYYNTNLIRNNKVYGCGCIQRQEIEKYLDKLKGLKAHELDIINRMDTEATQ
jgi:hypothetical protein